MYKYHHRTIFYQKLYLTVTVKLLKYQKPTIFTQITEIPPKNWQITNTAVPYVPYKKGVHLLSKHIFSSFDCLNRYFSPYEFLIFIIIKNVISNYRIGENREIFENVSSLISHKVTLCQNFCQCCFLTKSLFGLDHNIDVRFKIGIRVSSLYLSFVRFLIHHIMELSFDGVFLHL